jgi:hypothetical protein
MRRALATALAAASAALVPAAAATADSGVRGWDGTNPFACTLQQLGGGTDFPEPKADPFCVEYDKRHQNVNNLGVVEFLSKEPARVGVAGPKCFYFQRDHWVGTVVEGDQQTQTYAWDGSYYYDKAKGTGGAYVENFTVNGQTGDPTTVPGFPTQYKPYFGNGRGGVRADNQVPVDPTCVAKAKKHDPYRHTGPGNGGGGSGMGHCRVPGGTANRGIGGIKLRERRGRVRRSMGAPSRESLRWVSYCMTGGGRLVAAFDGRGRRARSVFVSTTARPFDLRGIRPGDRTYEVKKKLKPFKRFSKRHASRRLLGLRRRHQLFLVGIRRHRVKFIAVGRPKLSRGKAIRYANRTPSWHR